LGKYLSRVWLLIPLQLFLFLYVGLYHQDVRAEEDQPSPPSSVYDLFFTKALLHINQKKYPEAIEELNKALAVRPNDRDASYYLGVALIKVGRDKEAEEILKKVAALDPNFEKVHFDLGVAEYELGKYPEALRELGLAEKADPNNALVYYYQGLTYHHMGDYERSSPRFLRAVALAPELGLTAHYYAGIGFYHRGIFLEAKDEFEEAVKIDPSSSVARSAQEFLAQLETPRKTAKRWDLTLSTAYQYDSNVILLAGGSALPAGISRKGDNRILFYAKGGYRFLETQSWSLGAAYSLYQSLHDKLRTFDVQNHQGSAFLLYRQPWGQLRIPYEFNFALVDGDTFLRSHAVTPTLKIPESAMTFTELQYGFTSKDFVNTAQFSNNSDRDAVNHMAGIAQTLVLNKTGRFQIRYNYDRELTGSSPTEDDWAYQGHKLSGELAWSLPKGLRFDLEADYYLQYYTNPNSFSSPSNTEKRTDRIQTYTVTLSKTLGNWATLTLQYLYNRNASIIPVFDYDRSIVSVILAGNF
jgi:tetratricopeptide (TPR) repeat protein